MASKARREEVTNEKGEKNTFETSGRNCMRNGKERSKLCMLCIFLSARIAGTSEKFKKMLMLNKMTERMGAYLLKQGIIESGQEEVCIYGFQRICIDGINIMSICLIGILVGEPVGAFCFFVAFRSLRSYAGGYHSSTQWGCYVLTILIFIIALSTIKYFTISISVALILWALSGMAIFLWAPVEAENKPLDQMEIKVYGRKVKLIWCAETVCFLVSLIGLWKPVYESILLASICTSFSLVVGKVKRRKKQRGEN